MEPHLAELVGLAAVKQHILAGGGGIAEAIADVPSEGHALHLTGGAAPIPGVVIGPHPPAPVQHAEGVRRVKDVGFLPQPHLAPGPHAVDLLVEVEAPGLVKGRADDHGFLRLLRQDNGPVYGLAVHVEGQLPALRHVPEHQGIAPSGDGGGAPGRRLRQAGFPHGKGPHGALGPLPPLVKVQERNGVQAHVPVVIDGQGHGEVVVGHQVIVPLLDAGRRGLDIRPAIDGQEPLGIARLPQIAAAVQQGPRRGDLMLHHSALPLRFLHFITRRRIFPQGLPFSPDFLYTGPITQGGDPYDAGNHPPRPVAAFQGQ